MQPIVFVNYVNKNKNIFKIDNKRNSKKESRNQNDILKKLKEMKKKLLNNTKRNTDKYLLIKIDAKNIINLISYQSLYYLDNFEYEDAIIYDKRSFWRLYLICLFTKENILNTFYLNSPFDLKTINLLKLIFIYSCDLALNTIFYFNSKISEKYKYKGNNVFWFNLLNNLTISFISFIISFLITSIFQFLTNSKDSIEGIFRDEEKKLKCNKKYLVKKKTKKIMLENIIKIHKYLKCKILIFVIMESFIMLFFYYFVTAFCEVYKETQISWITDSIISFLISFPIELLISLIVCVIYKIAITKKLIFLFKLSILLYNLG